MRRRWVLIGVTAVVVVAAAVVGGRIVWEHSHRTTLEEALHDVPSAAKRISFTDWALVRQRLGQHLGDEPARAAVAKLMRKAYDRDYSAASSLNDAGAQVQEHLGFSPGNAQWEAYAQSSAGAAMVMRLDDGVDFDELAANLAALGFRRPSHDTGVWRGGADLIASIDPGLSGELAYIVLLPDRHLVVTSDTAGYAATAARVAGGNGDSAADLDSVSQMAGRVGRPAAAVVWTRDFACADLSMSKAAPSARAEADRLIAKAGKVSPLSGLVMAMAADRTLTVAEQFDSSDQAARNLRARAELAVGPAPGRGTGTFSDDFRLTSSRAVDSTVLLRLHPRRAGQFVLSALYDGPVLFATC